MDVQTALNEFVSANNGHPLDFDGQYGAQCVDEVQFWAKALGKRPFTGNAINLAGENPDQWTYIHNSPSAVPTPGSIMVYATNNSAVGTGPYGHVDIFLSGDVNSFTALDQNWAGKQYCQEVHHSSYAGILGWLQPIESAPTPPPTPSNFTVEVLRPTNTRSAATTAAPVAGSGLLTVGATFTAVGEVPGQDVNQNGVHTNLWFHSALGHFVWAGNCKRV